MNNEQWQQRQRMGYAWQKGKERRAKQREEFNRDQAELEAEQGSREEAHAFDSVHSPSISPKGAGWRSGTIAVPVSPPWTRRFGAGRVLLILFTLLSGWFLFAHLHAGNTGFTLLFVFVTVTLFLWQRSLGRRAHVERRARGIEGEARAVQRRMEDGGTYNIEVLSFRIERYDANGNRLPPVPVQMRGVSFDGTVQEGDQIRLSKDRKTGKILQVKRVYNLTTNNVVKAKGKGISAWLGPIVFLIVVVIIILCIVYA